MMLRYTPRVNRKLHFSVSKIIANYTDELESLITTKPKSETSKEKPKTSNLNTNTEDSLKKLFDSFSQKNRKYPQAGFRPMLRKSAPTNSNPSKSSLAKPVTPKPIDPKKTILFDKIPKDMESIVSFLAEKLPKNVLVRNPKNSSLSNFMTKYEAINFVNWNEEGIKILNENLTPDELKDLINDDTMYIEFPSHCLLSVIQVVKKEKMPLQQYKDEIKMKIIQTLGGQDLLTKIEDHEQTLKNKENKDKAANVFKGIQIKWECHDNDLRRKLMIATKALKSDEKVELILGPDTYLNSKEFKIEHYPVIHDYTRSKINSGFSIPNEEKFKEDLRELFATRHYNRKVSPKRRNEMMDMVREYLEENQAKYNEFFDVESFAVISIHSAVIQKAAEASSDVEDPRLSKNKKREAKNSRNAVRAKGTPPTPKKKEFAEPAADMYSMKIED